MKYLGILTIAFTLCACGTQVSGLAPEATFLKPGDTGYPLSAEALEAIRQSALPEGSGDGVTVRAVVGGLWVLAKARVFMNNCTTPVLLYGPNFQTGYGSYDAAMFYADAVSKQFYEQVRAYYGNCPASLRPNEIRWAQVKNGPGESAGGGLLKAFNGVGALLAMYWF